MKISKLLKKYLGSIYKRWDRLFPQPFQVYRRKQAYLFLDKSSMMDEGFIKFKDYEDRLIERAGEIIDAHDIDTLIDIGANLGYYTVQLGKLPRIKHILSFEPIRKLYIQTSANVLINGLLDKWTGFNLALSDTEGEEVIHYHPFYMGVSSMNAQWTNRFNRTETIQARRFDNLVGELTGNCFIKIDVEGWETNVLKGMLEFLQSNKAVMQIESNDKNLPEIQSLLSNIGYRWVGSPEADDHYFTNIADMAPQMSVLASTSGRRQEGHV